MWSCLSDRVQIFVSVSQFHSLPFFLSPPHSFRHPHSLPSAYFLFLVSIHLIPYCKPHSYIHFPPFQFIITPGKSKSNLVAQISAKERRVATPQPTTHPHHSSPMPVLLPKHCGITLLALQTPPVTLENVCPRSKSICLKHTAPKSPHGHSATPIDTRKSFH